MEIETETVPSPMVLTSYEIDKLRELVHIYHELDLPYEEGSAWNTLKLALQDYDSKCARKMFSWHAELYVNVFCELCTERTIDPAIALENDNVKQAIQDRWSKDDMANLLDEIC